MPASVQPVLDQVQTATLVLRVADLDEAEIWYKDNLGLAPLHRGQDGNTPPYAVYDLSGIILTVWQLPHGVRRDASHNDWNSYLILVYGGDIDALRERLIASGVQADEMRNSANNRFFWFYDLDHNRWEVSQPTTDAQRKAERQILER